MLGKIGRGLKNLFSQPVGKTATPTSQAPINPLSDAGYEALFLQLLEGVEKGWEKSQLLEKLGNRQDDRFFKSWLQRFGRQQVESPLLQPERARQMIKLGEMGCGELGEIAAKWGQQLQQKETRPLTQAEFEAIFQQILTGVSLGWDAPQIEQFFQQLGEQGKPELWVNWLREYQKQQLTSSSPNYEWASPLLRLGEKTTSVPKFQELAETAAALGKELLEKRENESVWEYNGLDVVR